MAFLPSSLETTEIPVGKLCLVLVFQTSIRSSRQSTDVQISGKQWLLLNKQLRKKQRRKEGSIQTNGPFLNLQNMLWIVLLFCSPIYQNFLFQHIMLSDLWMSSRPFKHMMECFSFLSFCICWNRVCFFLPSRYIFRHGTNRTLTWLWCGMNTLPTLWCWEVLIRELLFNSTSRLWCLERATQYIGMGKHHQQHTFTSLTSTSMLPF